MARKRFQTLTEQMFYILLCLHRERRGVEVREAVRSLTAGQVSIGSGTLYDLLEQFLQEGLIEETGRRQYRITEAGRQRLAEEYERLCRQTADYRWMVREEGEQ